MTAADFERNTRQIAADWVFVQWITTVDKTDYAIKLRLHVDTECFVQIYANVEKDLISYTLVLNRARIYGRDCDGGVWHRHPYHTPDTHDFSAEGSQAVTLRQFLTEVQQILQNEKLL